MVMPEMGNVSYALLEFLHVFINFMQIVTAVPSTVKGILYSVILTCAISA